MNFNWPLYQRIKMHAAEMPLKPAYLDIETGQIRTFHDLLDRIHHHHDESNHYRILVKAQKAIDFPEMLLAGLFCHHAVYVAAADASDAEISAGMECTQSLDRHPDSQGEILLNSSGTTGLPKIVRRTRQSLDVVGQRVAQALELCPGDKIIAAIPMSHSYGLEHCILAALWAGSTVLICRGLDLSMIYSAFSLGATIFPAVPTMIEMLGQLIQSSDIKHKLRLVYSAGAILPVQVSRRFESVWNMPVGQIYGLTEVGSVLYRPPGSSGDGVVGRPLPGVSMKLISTDGNNSIISNGMQGEVAIQTDSMMSGYVGAEMQRVDAHFLTGDLGIIEASGELRLTGRLRLLIDVGGMKVNPLEVEAVLNEHPDVSASVVLPLKLSDTIQKVRAIVIPVNPDSPPHQKTLQQFVRARLSTYKVPRVITYRSSFPRSPTGKILRQALESV